MRIVIISPFQFRLQRGIERFTYSLANAMADLGNEVVIYSYSKKGAKWGDSRQGVKYRMAPKLKYYEGYLAVFLFRKWLGKDKPDSIILNFLYHGEEWLPKNLPYTYVLNSPASQIPIRYEFIKKTLPRFKKMQMVAVSEMVKREAIPFLNNNRISVIPNGVDTNYFKPSSKSISQSKIFLITLAAFEERKGIQYVIKALAEFGKLLNTDFEYQIFGDGPYLQELKDLVSSLAIGNSIFINPSSTNACTELQKADIFILPSMGEAFALAPIEAMACGLPIIVSNFDPYPEFVTDTFGKMVNRENGMEIINAINVIESNYKEMSQEARKASMAYDWSSLATRYLEILS